MSRLALLHISTLHPHPANLRTDLGDLTELAASIRAHGIMQPLIVAPHPTETRHYQVIAGHRRLAAAKLVRLSEIPALIRRAAITTQTAIQVMLIENCQRADLNPMDKAEGIAKLRDTGMSGREIGRAIGMSDAHVSLHLSLLHLAEPDRRRLRAGDLALNDAARLARDIRAYSKRPKGERSREGRSGWEPLHFTASHPLARTARARCNSAGHSVRGRVGKVACGQCWEATIRADERGEPREPEPPPPRVKGTPEYRAWHAAYERDRNARRKIAQITA